MVVGYGTQRGYNMNTRMFSCSNKNSKIAFIGTNYVQLGQNMGQVFGHGDVRDILEGHGNGWKVRTARDRMVKQLDKK